MKDGMIPWMSYNDSQMAREMSLCQNGHKSHRPFLIEVLG